MRETSDFLSTTSRYRKYVISKKKVSASGTWIRLLTPSEPIGAADCPQVLTLCCSSFVSVRMALFQMTRGRGFLIFCPKQRPSNRKGSICLIFFSTHKAIQSRPGFFYVPWMEQTPTRHNIQHTAAHIIPLTTLLPGKQPEEDFPTLILSESKRFQLCILQSK